MKFSVIVPTLNAGKAWPTWIDAIKLQSIKPDNILVVDSGSVDETVTLSYEAGFIVQTLPSGTFNHGGTRKQAVLQNLDLELVIFLTQDAILSDPDALKQILLPFKDAAVAAVCGRQIPHKTAGAIAAHARYFNYPATSFVRSYADRSVCGIKTAFLSNSFAAYRVDSLVGIGLFPESVIFGEDMYAAAKLLKAGGKIAYAAKACVYHSHNYSFLEEFMRYFDMGVFHAREPWLRKEFGGAEKEGFKFVFSELKYLARYAFWRIPEGLLRTALRYVGFRLGLFEKHLPVSIKRVLSMNKAYFKRS